MARSSMAVNRSLEADLARQAGVRRALEQKAEQAAVRARVIGAGIGRGPEDPADAVEYEDTIRTDGATLYTDDPAGHLIEYGSVNNPPYAPLRKAAEAVGGQVHG